MVSKIQTFEEKIKLFPHRVVIKPVKITGGARLRMREWLSEQHIRVHHLYGDAADVVWNSTWSAFNFKREDHALLFRFHWTNE